MTYILYVNDKVRLVNKDLKLIKSTGYALAAKGYKVAYLEVKDA